MAVPVPLADAFLAADAIEALEGLYPNDEALSLRRAVLAGHLSIEDAIQRAIAAARERAARSGA